MKDIIIIGAGGLGRETAWLIQRINKDKPQWNLRGFVDDNPEMTGKSIGDVSVLGDRSVLGRYPDAWVICAIADSKIRQKIVNAIKREWSDTKFAILVDPSVAVADINRLAEGTMVFPNSVISVDVIMGAHVIVCYGCTVGHDTQLDDFVTLYPGVNVSGAVRIHKGGGIGTGAQVIQGKSIGEYAFIGAGAVVVKDIPEGITAVGCPAKPM